MAASETFDTLLKQVQTSNLNYRIEQSPFSAVISLKKSLLKDKSGNFLMPPQPDSVLLHQAKVDNHALVQKIYQLENVVNSIKNDYENVVLDCENAYKTISKLEHELESTRFKEIKEENEVDKHGLILKNYQHIESLVEENKKI